MLIHAAATLPADVSTLSFRLCIKCRSLRVILFHASSAWNCR
jgi:hypothetical protein